MSKLARYSSLIGGALALTAAFSSPAIAQNDAEPTQLPPVEVTAQNIHEVVRAFVADVSEVHERGGQIARFDTRICPGVVNLPAAFAQTLNDQIARAAYGAGRAVGRPGCVPNVLVIFTDDSDRLANDLADAHPSAFAFYVAMNENAHSALAAFRAPGQTVRTWYMARKTQGIGQAFPGNAPRNSLYNTNSRLSSGYATVINRSIIVVDTSRLGPIKLLALGDYLAMIALARIDTTASTEHLDTILNLFSAPEDARPDSLSAWDEAYLRGVYSARPNSATTYLHVNEIASRMARRVAQTQ